MATPIHHAMSSARKWGGEPEDYLEIHRFFDSSKVHYADGRHRALYHHSEGIDLMERLFGATITTSAGRVVPTRWVGEQHVMEDLGWIPTVADWLSNIHEKEWMFRGQRRLSAEFPAGFDAERMAAPED